MNIVNFITPGVMPIESATIMGIHVKETESPIGFFGTGLKYAIAVLLRNGQDVEIKTGLDTYTFTTEELVFRGESKDLIVLNKNGARVQTLGFTLDLGKSWELWEAYRELYSNTLDENGSISLEPLRSTNNSMISVTGEEFYEIHLNRHRYFIESNNRPIEDSAYMSVHPRPYDADHSIFYRGIKILTSKSPTEYRYNIKKEMQLTENRTASVWEAMYWLSIGVVSLPDCDVLRHILTAAKDTLEYDIPIADLSVSKDDAIITVIKDISNTNRFSLTPQAIALLHKIEGVPDPEIVPRTPIQDQYIIRACRTLAAAGFNVDNDNIYIATGLGSRVLGHALRGKIYLTESVFTKGTKFVASTILEEHLHTEGFRDLDREFQDKLLDTILDLIENYIVKEPV